MTCRHIQNADLHGCNVLCCRGVFRPGVRLRSTLGYCPSESDGLAIRLRFRSFILVYFSWVGLQPNLLWCNKDSIWESSNKFRCDWTLNLFINVLCVPAWSWDGTATQRLDRFRVGSLHTYGEPLCDEVGAWFIYLLSSLWVAVGDERWSFPTNISP